MAICGLEMLEACTEKMACDEGGQYFPAGVSRADGAGIRCVLTDRPRRFFSGVVGQSAQNAAISCLISWIWKHGETRAFAFGGIDALHKAGFQQPPAAEYTLVYDGELICPVGQDERDILERNFCTL